MKIRYIILIFLVIGAFFIVRYNNYKFDNPDDRVSFVKDFGKWMFGVGKSVKNVVGAATQQDWLPNKTNNTAENTTQNASVSKPKVYVVYE